MGSDTEDAASSLHLLATHYREHPQTGPSERRAPSVNPGAPLNLGILDRLEQCVDEVVEHARADAGDSLGPLPPRVRDVYDWWTDSTADASPEVRLRRDIVIYRQGLENAIRLGEHKRIRTHPCPGCHTWGLQWEPHRQKALCLNRKCRDRNGMARTWSLARLATQYVTEQESRISRAT
ncbi:hypothetical protein [Streptomyces sp. NBC_01483]|uniref:hypothetical protein n=1 Tax=Streptomyces sp. NBC_01483 TaxID=2903883 RepID=UPI002E3778A3|nr:hypothetical protein [Streptomyces sp. NBC_01483]